MTALTISVKKQDKISGFTGIVTSETRYLNGCIRLCISPQSLHEGKVIGDEYFDDTQVEILGDSDVKPEKDAKVGGSRPAPKGVPNPR